MKLFFYSAMTCVLLSACTTDNGTEVVNVVPAGLEQPCKEKGNVYSEAPYFGVFGVFTETTRDKLIDLAKESALRLGANAIVIGEPVEKDGKYTLTGKAYSCPSRN
jgi:hypothetical protein